MAQRAQFSKPRSLLGLVLIFVGVSLVLEELDLASGLLAYFWPSLLVLLGGIQWISGGRIVGTVFAGLGILWGWTIYDPTLGFWQLFWEHWHLLLVAAGVILVFRSFVGDPETEPDDGPRLSVFGLLSTPQRKLNAEEFQGGDLLAVLGGVDLDLKECELHPGGAVIGMLTWWGGMKVRVPKHWKVEMRIFSLLGASEDNTRQEGNGRGPVLTLQGLVVMGGVEITN